MLKTDDDIAATWEHMHKYSPAPRYRRRLLLNYLKRLQFADCLDVGCAQGHLLQEIVHRFKVKGHGCDISKEVIKKNKINIKECVFLVLDIEKNAWPKEKQFDVVISSEVVEHILDWKKAIFHLTSSTKHHLLLTLPGGKVRPIDKKVGHFRHFQGDEIKHEIEQYGFTCTVKRVGFPLHSFYKRLINFFMPDKIYEQFSGARPYSFSQKCISQFIHCLFYLNDFFRGGEQLIVFAKRNRVKKDDQVRKW
jgi:SAM-dependent methyltransferase